MNENDDLIRRATAAYFRSGADQQPNRSQSDVFNLDGKVYVVLASGEIMAVYRLRNDGVLRRMRRYPKDITKHYPGGKS